MRNILNLTTAILATSLALGACGHIKTPSQAEISAPKAMALDETVATTLDHILAAQDETVQARYPYRHPKETLQFFEIKPGMTVAEVLPGGGWYTKILLPLIGDEGTLIAMDYALDMWPNFGGFATAEFIENRKAWPQTWSEKAMGWRGGAQAEIAAFTFGERDTSRDGTADIALFIRALHNLNRFSDIDDYMGEALADVHALLKEDGILGVVQHRAPAESDETWANGAAGYLQQERLIARIEAAGFKLVETSEINANPKDQPSDSDIVWRLPPSLSTSKDDPELKLKMQAIGESDRMTLKFRKI